MIDVHEIRYLPFETLVALIIYWFQYVFAALMREKSLLLIRFFAITSFSKIWKVVQIEGSTKTHSWSP